VLVPDRRGDEWTREWEGELWYRASRLGAAEPNDGHAARRLVVRTLGAFPHAVWTLTDEMRVDPMLQDLRYALRGIAKRPTFAALVIATLALGIGANTAMFSIVHSVLLKPLPYDRPEELVYMYGAFKLSDHTMVSPPDYLDYRERNSVFASLAAHTVFGTAVLTGGAEPVFGAAPALHAVRSDLASSRKSLGKSSSTRGGAATRDTLVVAQVALSFVLLVGAGLLVRSLWQLQRVETGFDASHLLTAEVSLPRTRYADRAAVQGFWDELLERVRAIPGVESAGATTLLPLRGGGGTYFYIEGQPPASDAQKMNATVSTVTDDYFGVMRIPLVSGRLFNAGDRDGAGVTVISQRLATRLFPNATAIGKRLVVDFGRPFTAEIVGVVADVRIYGQASDAPDLMYFASRQPNAGFGFSAMSLAARARGIPDAVAPQVRAALHAMDADIPLAGL
jgi:hypothetical protein